MDEYGRRIPMNSKFFACRMRMRQFHKQQLPLIAITLPLESEERMFTIQGPLRRCTLFKYGKRQSVYPLSFSPFIILIGICLLIKITRKFRDIICYLLSLRHVIESNRIIGPGFVY